MTPTRHVALLLALTALPAVACGSADSAGLYTPVHRVEGGGYTAGGGYVGGGGFVSTGGTIGSGSTMSSGGSGGGGAGGTSGTFGSGGTGGTGGTLASGGTTGSGGTGGGTGGSGAAASILGCDLEGTWASYIQAPVSWPAAPLILLAGTGSLQQWDLSLQHLVDGKLMVDTVPCSIYLPDLQADLFGGYARFGIRFPDSLFDVGGVPWVPFEMKLNLAGTTAHFDTDPFAIVVGATLPNATAVTWPPVSSLLVADHDQDGKVGVTVVPATGTGYSFPPTDLQGGTADLIYIAERTVSSLHGEIVTCDEVRASVTIHPMGDQPGINSTVVGCRKAGGAECAAADAAFVDALRPQFAPTGDGTMVSRRIPDGSTCADVRALFPVQ